MNLRQLAALSRAYSLKAHLGVLAGVAVATTVLVGALVVGDSVRGSLRSLVLDRLGNVDQVILPNQPFREELAEEISLANDVQAAPVWILPGSLSYNYIESKRRLNKLNLFGVDERYWELGQEGIELVLSDRPLANQSISKLVGLSEQEFILKLPSFNALPSDSALGERVDTSLTYRTKLDLVSDSNGISNFQLYASQVPPRNVFLDLKKVNSLLEFDTNKANAILINSNTPIQELQINPSLKDYGLSLEQIESGGLNFLQLESDSLVLSERTVAAARSAFGDSACAEGITYLANLIQLGDRSIPYSTVTGTDTLESVGNLNHGEIALNRWAADDLDAKIGDEISLTYYEPESTHGKLAEAKPISLKIVKIVELEKDGKPTQVADPRLSPRLEGVSDVDSINNWDLPFELVHKIRQKDEDYWDTYSTTPKAFISLSQARELWSTRWGSASWLRINSTKSIAEIKTSLTAAIEPASFGYEPKLIREEMVSSASGSTPFDVLFLMFSAFLIASALMLISLLVRLTIDQKARQIGLLGALGFERPRLNKLLTAELLPILLIGAGVGILTGVGYAFLLIIALKSIWIDAIATPFLELHVNSLTLIAGFSVSLIISYLTVRVTLRSATKSPPRLLMSASNMTSQFQKKSVKRFSRKVLSIGLLLLSLLLAYLGKDLRGESAAGAFFGVGTLLLVAMIMIFSEWLSRQRNNPHSYSLAKLAFTNLSRGGSRTLLTIGLTAAACFMILVTGIFRLSPTNQGTGGFSLVIESEQPIYHDLNTEEGRYELAFSKKETEELNQWHFYSFRMESGQDASCQNLFQASRPRLLGATDEFIQYGGFQWAEYMPGFDSNPWLALDSSTEDETIPVILDYNTAVYAMKLYGGVGSEFSIKDEYGNDLNLQIVGLLKNSMLQGVAILKEGDLIKHFPSTNGYQFFMAETLTNKQGKDLAETTQSLSLLLESRLVDYGVESELASKRLSGYLSVQNTYLSTFQALGALGVFLGAVGLTVAQYRNLAQRQGELALMRSSGFSNQRLRAMVLIENLWQLSIGVMIGTIAAMIAVAPLTKLIGTSFPWITAVFLLLGTVLIGRLGASLASSSVLRSPILKALRAE